MLVRVIAVIMVIASTELAIARLDGQARLAPRRHVQLIATTKDIAWAVLVFAIPNTPDGTAPFSNVPTAAQALARVST